MGLVAAWNWLMVFLTVKDLPPRFPQGFPSAAIAAEHGFTVLSDTEPSADLDVTKLYFRSVFCDTQARRVSGSSFWEVYFNGVFRCARPWGCLGLCDAPRLLAQIDKATGFDMTNGEVLLLGTILAEERTGRRAVGCLRTCKGPEKNPKWHWALGFLYTTNDRVGSVRFTTSPYGGCATTIVSRE
jgi:hypothetical protein